MIDRIVLHVSKEFVSPEGDRVAIDLGCADSILESLAMALAADGGNRETISTLHLYSVAVPKSKDNPSEEEHIVWRDEDGN